MAQEVIATENTIVHDENLGIDRLLVAGQPVPPDLVDPYRAKVGDQAVEKQTSPASSSASDYRSQTVEQLQAEADKRELTVEGSGKDGNVVKADLVSALEASDASK